MSFTIIFRKIFTEYFGQSLWLGTAELVNMITTLREVQSPVTVCEH